MSATGIRSVEIVPQRKRARLASGMPAHNGFAVPEADAALVCVHCFRSSRGEFWQCGMCDELRCRRCWTRKRDDDDDGYDCRTGVCAQCKYVVRTHGYAPVPVADECDADRQARDRCDRASPAYRFRFGRRWLEQMRRDGYAVRHASTRWSEHDAHGTV